MPQAPDHPPATSRLPPPPAPVARDANPWPMPGGPGTPRLARADRPPPARQPLPSSAPPSSSRHGLSRIVPIAVFLAVLGSIASGAFEALRRGDRIGAIVPLIVLGIVAAGLWRSIRRARGR